MSHEIAAFGLGKLSIVRGIGTRGTNLSAKVMRLTEPRAEEGFITVKVTGFGGNEPGFGSAVSRRGAIGRSARDWKSLLLGSSEGTAMRARALKRYIKDQQASNRTVYPTYDLEEKLYSGLWVQRYRNRLKRQPASHCSPDRFLPCESGKAMNDSHLNEGLSRGVRSSILKERLCV
jgi:hypothetical protein